jgi:hypothetical protein
VQQPRGHGEAMTDEIARACSSPARGS